MSVPSMVHHRSGGGSLVRNIKSGDAFHEPAADVSDADEDVVADERPGADDDDENDRSSGGSSKELPDCKVRRNYTCTGCDFFTQNPRLYLYHLRDDHDQKIKVFECPSCLYASKHFQKLLRHSKMVHGTSEGVSVAETSRRSRRRSIEECEESAPEEQQLQPQDEEVEIDEMLPEDPDGPALFKCSVCDFTSRNRVQLGKHEREEHIKTKFFRCSKCTYVTHIKARYTKHVKYHSMPMIKCDMCDFRTPYKWNLDRHCKNHNGKGAFRCSACNFTADIKQSLTVHEMNHHVPPVGQAAGLGVGRRRNKVGASDTTAAEEAAAANQDYAQIVQSPETTPATEPPEEAPRSRPKIKITPKKSKASASINGASQEKQSDFIHPDDIVQHSNGKVYIKNKCSLCNFKTAWSGEMAKHEKHFHNIGRDLIKKTSRPVPNLIPIPFQSRHKEQDREPAMSQSDINDICSKSKNSALKDFASLFVSEDVFKNPSTSKVPDLIPTSIFTSKRTATEFKQKNASFFDHLKEKLELGAGCNLVCDLCGHESKCLTEQAKHKKVCGGKESNRLSSIIPVHNISASRCQYCRQRCKSSADLYNHLQQCAAAIKYYHSEEVKQEDDTSSEHEHELKIDEDRRSAADEFDNKPHPMENKVFVWNDIMVPMDIDVDDSNYEYTEDRIDDNASLDLSIRTQSPANSESSYIGQENNNNINTNHNLQSASHHSPVPPQPAEKIPTHGNDISVAQHKRVFKCPHCTFWASTASRFHVHIVGHLNKKPFECSLCSYRSNWRWDITKHIKLKSVRDQAHESAKVLMTDETGRRNYTKYNKYLTEIPLSSLQSSNETSGGSGTRPRSHDKNAAAPSTSKSEKTKFPTSGDFNSLLKLANVRSPTLKEKQLLSNVTQEKKSRANCDNKRTLFKCKKCNFRDASRDILLQHVKGHYEQAEVDQEKLLQQAMAAAQVTVTPAALSLMSNSPGAAAAGLFSSQDLSLRGTSPDRDEASVNNSPATKGGSASNAAPFRCGHCNQVSNWKHVIQRHCRLKHSGDIRVVSTKNGQEKIEIDEQIDDPDDADAAPYFGAFKCDLCPYHSDNHDQYQDHLGGHQSQSASALTCSFCKFGAADDKDLQDHLRLHSRKFRCALCPYETNSKSQYTYHRQFHKDRGGQYTCSQCSYNVSKRHLLHQHLKVHGINVPSVKLQEDFNEVGEEASDEASDELFSEKSSLDSLHFADVPLVWVSKDGKFSKMFKCRFCPHVNLRKVNIQEHEKMHSIRDKTFKGNDLEHRCTECNYVCNNAGVLSSHVKVHQGQGGIVHCLVDPVQSDEEQIRELTRALGSIMEGIDTSQFLEVEMEEVDASSDNVLYFCEECPARFLKEKEYDIHKQFHAKKLAFKCDHCSYAADSEQYLSAHLNTHTEEYQKRTKILKSQHLVSPQHPESPNLKPVKGPEGEDSVWIVDQAKSELERKNNILATFLSKPLKSSQTVPLSGTDLFQQRSEAQQRQKRLSPQRETLPQPRSNKSPDPQFGDQMNGNPDFVYQTYIKNGRTKEKRYKCPKCPSAFEKREQYRVHLGLHGSNQRYNCDFCDYSVKYYANFTQHLKKHKFSDEAQAARKIVADDDGSESTEEDSQLQPEQSKTDWCPHCPFVNKDKNSMENHLKNHQSVSGVRHACTCDHCDYSVPQAHLLKEHEKLHFVPNKANHINGFMICDNLKLTASNASEASKDSVTAEDVIYEESNDEADKFNNNKGENEVINVQTGELDVKTDVSDLNVDETNYSEMEVH